MARTKYVTIESYGVIPALGGIMGPITSPCNVDLSVIISLINSGKVVYEVNPKNIKEKILLNKDNVLKYNFNPKVVKKETTIEDKPIKKENAITTKSIKDEPIKVSIINTNSKPSIKPDVAKNTIVNKEKSNKIVADLFVANKYS
jgi:hypothetical protein